MICSINCSHKWADYLQYKHTMVMSRKVKMMPLLSNEQWTQLMESDLWPFIVASFKDYTQVNLKPILHTSISLPSTLKTESKYQEYFVLHHSDREQKPNEMITFHQWSTVRLI